MKIVILGGDGYLGWPMAMNLSYLGHEVLILDSYIKRKISLACNSSSLIVISKLELRTKVFQSIFNRKIDYKICDCSDYESLSSIFDIFQPDAVIHFAEQPSAPYSMTGYREAKFTLENNLGTTFALIWSVIHKAPNAHIIKLGTMGEYGTPNIDIEEGWLNIVHKGRTEKFLYPRQAGSLYHTSKVLDTDLLWFYVRMYGLRVTDLMQGPVYGILTEESLVDDRLLTSFHYDDIFGTVVNRFLTQVVAGIPMTVYGDGGQTRGYLNIKDTLQCIGLALNFPPEKGEFRVLNQFTETFTVSEIADKIFRAAKTLGLNPSIKSIENPRVEKESHYYNVQHTGLLDLGLKPNFMNEHTIIELLEKISKYKKLIQPDRIMPRVNWR